MDDSSTEQGKPSGDQLFEIANGQEGYFTAAQARNAGYSPQLLAHHARNGKFERELRGVYRIVHYPVSEQGDRVALWLWSNQEGVFSHESALMMHWLSDALPDKVHFTLPKDWEKRRVKIPQNVITYFADIPEKDRAWVGAVPVTIPERTLADCAESRVSPELVRQAVNEMRRRGLFPDDLIYRAVKYLHDFDEGRL